jgi:hypothetical protein
MQYVAIGFSLAIGAAVGFLAGREAAEVFTETWRVPWAIGGGIGLIVFIALYVPLLRPIADILNDRLSATHQRFRATRTGTGLDEIPLRPTGVVASRPLEKCRFCGAPGKPICDACQAQFQK